MFLSSNIYTIDIPIDHQNFKIHIVEKILKVIIISTLESTKSD